MDELTSMGPGKCFAITADMQQLPEVERLVFELERREKALHILVNNAGATWGDSVDDYPVCGLSEQLILCLILF